MQDKSDVPIKEIALFHNDVYTWNKRAGNKVNSKMALDTAKKISKDIETYNNRLNLIVEEVKEYDEGVKNNDRIEIVDALVDILYVVLGMMTWLGIPANNILLKCTKEFTNINLTYSYKVLDTCHKYFVGKNCYLIAKLSTIIAECLILGKYYKFNMVGAIHEVCISNNSKFAKTEQEAIDTVKWYKNSKKYKDLYKYPIYTKEGNVWVIKNKPPGKKANKILKCINYSIIKS